MTELRVRSVSLGWREPFLWRRLAVGLMLSLVPLALCIALKAGVLALVALAIGSYPWPIRVSSTSRGVSLRWLFVSQTLPVEHLVRVSLANDPRRWLWPRRMVLLLERQGKKQVVLFAREATLVRLLQLTRLSLPALCADTTAVRDTGV